MRRASGILCLLTSVLWYVSLVVSSATAYAQSDLPTPDQLDDLLAPVALYPDALVAQICAAATDPQQILDVNTWSKQNAGLSPQARTDAAQAQGFDPAFIALINFPQVLDTMAQNIDSYATIGRAFSANQATVMDAIQRLRQQAYAAGNLESNQYQTVDVQNQGGVQAVTIVPANPQVVYVPVYNPTVVYATPDPGAVAAATLLTFGAGIALGAWISGSSHPWGWGGWGWNWGHRTVIVHNNVWVVNNRYRPPRPYYHYRPPVYGPPIHARPPNNWHDRPYYRPPPGGGRPPGGGPGGRPPGGGYPGKPPGGGPGGGYPGNGKPPGGGNPGNGRPPGGGKPPGDGRPPGGGKPPGGGTPPGGGKPPGGGTPPGGGKPPGGGTPPGGGKPPGGGTPPGGGKPPGGGTPPGGGRPPGGGTPGGPSTRPSPGVMPQPRPGVRPTTPATRPSPGVARPQPQARPPSNFAGYPGKAPAPSNTGARPSAFGGSHNPGADRAAASHGRSSVNTQQRQQQPQRAPQPKSGGQRR
jgi:Protein of unknown function (DUF3300)